MIKLKNEKAMREKEIGKKKKRKIRRKKRLERKLFSTRLECKSKFSFSSFLALL